ncbi:MAG: hypothetical protein R3B92_00230 [Patescibacteria group bacterium]
MTKNKKIAIALASTLFLLTIIGGVTLFKIYKSQNEHKFNKGGRHYNENKRQLLNKKGQTSQNKDCLADDCLQVADLTFPVGDLPIEVANALDKAIEDEYKAYATYESVIKKFGNVRPFIMIIRAEEQHISSLKSIYDKYGLEIPENTYTGTIEAPTTLADACSIGVTAEIANSELYKTQLLPTVSAYSDITGVFTKLMNASAQNHLPAFEKCSN